MAISKQDTKMSEAIYDTKRNTVNEEKHRDRRRMRDEQKRIKSVRPTSIP